MAVQSEALHEAPATSPTLYSAHAGSIHPKGPLQRIWCLMFLDFNLAGGGEKRNLPALEARRLSKQKQAARQQVQY